MHLSRLRKPADFGHIKSDLAAYFDIYDKATGRGLDSARVLELGYGQRPFRIIALQSLGISAAGIDLDAPLYGLDVRTVARIAQRNGSLVRSSRRYGALCSTAMNTGVSPPFFRRIMDGP
jgi:hypothetical protein